MNRTQTKALSITLVVVALALGITGMVRVKQPALYAAILPKITGVKSAHRKYLSAPKRCSNG